MQLVVHLHQYGPRVDVWISTCNLLQPTARHNSSNMSMMSQCLRVQEAFNVRGAFWWLRWLLPSFGRTLESGLRIPTSSSASGGSGR